MKKIILSFIALTGLLAANAQDGNNLCVYNALNNYSQGGGSTELERAMKCSDDAAANDQTSGKWKTWYYRGQLYTQIFMDSVLKKKFANASFESVKAFKKLKDINDPKFKDWEQASIYLLQLENFSFNAGAEKYNTKDFNQAAMYFFSIRDINTILEWRQKKGAIANDTVLKYAAICAENAGNTDMLVDIYNDWIKLSEAPMAYNGLGAAYKKKGKIAESKKIVDEGIAKYPKDANLLVQKINFFLEDSNYTAALAYVSNLLDVEPRNAGALFIKGLAFESLGKGDSVIYYYSKATEVDPKYDKAWNNLGAWYVNSAKPLFEEMNKLGNSAAENKRAEELRVKIKDLYLKGKPYLQKATELNPGDEKTKKVLTKIGLFIGE